MVCTKEKENERKERGIGRSKRLNGEVKQRCRRRGIGAREEERARRGKGTGRSKRSDGKG